MIRSRPARFATVFFGALVLASCAVNPATGRRELMFVSEGQEIAMGQQADPEIVASFGLYPDSGLQQYVRGLGTRLAGVSERPDLPWTFRLLDDPTVNAFALPGGFNYVTRGIMAYFNSEAELVAVMGHEIGHVTARHSARQMTQQQLAGVGLVAGMILVPDLQDYAGAAAAGLQLMFLRFSRDDEREADDLGFRYMARVGYDPREMPKVFAMLDRVSQASGGGRAPGWLSTHPDPADREQRIAQRVAALPNQDFAALAVRREEYLRRIDGMVFGNNPREGYFRGGTFIHPELAFWIDFPEGWRTLNQKQAVLGQAPDQDAMMELTLAEGSDPAAAARAFAAEEGITAGAPRTGAVNGLTAATVGFTASTDQTFLEGLAMFVRLGDHVFRLLGYAPRSRWRSYDGPIQASFGSFERLTDRDALNVQPWRLDVAEVDRNQTLAEFHARQRSPASLDQIALINQMDPQTRLQRGQLVKTVVGRPLP